MNSTQKRSKLNILTECSILVALATVLSLIKMWEMPLGGSITLLSMLPICILALRHDLKTSIGSAFVYAVLQLALGLPSLMSWGMNATMWTGSVLFDYLLPFTFIGLAGIFKEKGKWGIYAGTAFALFLRFVSHFISGSIFFANWCPDGWNVYVYSIAYNGGYMLPELVLTMIGLVIITRFSFWKK